MKKIVSIPNTLVIKNMQSQLFLDFKCTPFFSFLFIIRKLTIQKMQKNNFSQSNTQSRKISAQSEKNVDPLINGGAPLIINGRAINK